MDQDAIVIGSGPVGVAAAVEGATQGRGVLLVDGGELSPDGVLRTHALAFHQLRETALARLRGAGPAGAGYEGVKRCWTAAHQAARNLAEAEHARIRAQLAALDVRVVSGPARLLAPGRVRVADGSVREAPVVLVAAGCRPRRPERFAGHDGFVRDPVSVLRQDAPPRSLLVIGAEEEGCEIASLFAGLGTAVTLLDRRRRMLRYVDREIVEVLYRGLHGMGVEIALGESVERIRRVESGTVHAAVELGSGRAQRWECVALSAGRIPELDGLDLEVAGVALDAAGFVMIDDLHRTSVDGVYAAGEATSGCLQTHGLPREGREAMRNALGADEVTRDPTLVGILSIPEIAMVGLSEEMCVRLDVPHVTGSAHFEELALAGIRGDRAGMLKLVVDRNSRQPVGAHVIGADARDLVQRAVSALRHEESVDELARSAVATPSFSEAWALAANRCRRALARGGEGTAEPPVRSPEGRQGASEVDTA